MSTLEPEERIELDVVMRTIGQAPRTKAVSPGQLLAQRLVRARPGFPKGELAQSIATELGVTRTRGDQIVAAAIKSGLIRKKEDGIHPG